YGPREEPSAGSANAPRATGSEIVVVPRFGTISPWSSKATDIAHVCGLEAVLRIERGIAWSIAASQPLSRATLEKVAAPLFDRMTETALFARADAARLFVHEKTRTLRTVSLANGRAA